MARGPNKPVLERKPIERLGAAGRGREMSYCRFSTDDFQCDVYCYESDAGFQLHVASNKPDFKEPLPPPIDWGEQGQDGFNEKYLKRHRKVMEMVESADRISINRPHAGKSFCFDTPDELADFLVVLEGEGYRFPGKVIDCLREEGEELRQQAGASSSPREPTP